MVELRDVQTGLVVGHITEAQLQLLVEVLEEETAYDRDYYLDEGTLALLEEHGADAALLATLRRALTGRASVELEWSRQE